MLISGGTLANTAAIPISCESLGEQINYQMLRCFLPLRAVYSDIQQGQGRTRVCVCVSRVIGGEVWGEGGFKVCLCVCVCVCVYV